MFSYLPAVVIVILILTSAIKIIREYERAVIFRLGKFSGVKGPGLILLIPGIDKMIKVDRRIVTMDIPSQDIITKDNVTLKVNGVVYFRVNNAEKAVINVENYIHATEQIAQTTLRSIVGRFELDDLLTKREEINNELQVIIDEQTEPWGIKVSNVELKAIDLPLEMQRAMARQAEAEREKRAKLISAQGEFDASAKLAEAAKILSQEEDAITLRYLDTMRDISTSNGNSTTFFPIPVELFKKFMK